MISNPPKIGQLSLALYNYYLRRGRESAEQVDQDLPLVEQMRLEIAKLFEDAPYIDDRLEVAAAWSKGFSAGIRQRVEKQWAVQTLFNGQPFYNGPDAATSEDEAAARHRRIEGTITLRRKTVKGGV